MREITIGKNEANQRLDRFLKKYLNEASNSFIYKMIRKKNIKVNKGKAEPESILMEGDTIQLFLSDETIDKFKSDKEARMNAIAPDIFYEDDNIVLINKPVGILSHGDGQAYEENVVDSLISYLILKGDYVPRIEKTFTPAICNRLDRNTSGIIIGAKNSSSLRAVNSAIKDMKVHKYYKVIVKGEIHDGFEHKGFMSKNDDRNIVKISSGRDDDSKEVHTRFRVIKTNGEYTILEAELITGRTHQIRSTLKALGFPVVGDRKYGDSKTNDYFNKRYKLDNQWLHGYKVVFGGFEEPFSYLNGKEFTTQPGEILAKIELDLFSR